MTSKYSLPGCLLGSVLALIFAADIAHAQNAGTIRAANPNTPGTGVGPAAAAAMRGPLSVEDDVARKDSLDAAVTRAERSAAPADDEAAGRATAAGAPTIEGKHTFDGLITQAPKADMPTNVAGSIGPTRYIQAANNSVAIINRNSDNILTTGTLRQLAGTAASVVNFNPQIMWDPTTDRFYYVMNSVFAANDNRISFGFSKTADPASISATDWCQYDYKPALFPDFPRLGDSQHFLIIGVNNFNGANFKGSDLIAISKPQKGTACPAPGSFKIGAEADLRDNTNQRVFSPVPANQIDNNPKGYVVARSLKLPSNRLWFFNVIRNSGNGNPVFKAARALTVPSYDIPPTALQPGTRGIDTLDARPTQAVQAINPKGGHFSFYMQHTTLNDTGTRSEVRWYVINPVPSKPVVLRDGEISSRGDFLFNAAISPDRRKDGNTSQFGENFVIQYNVSSSQHGYNPRIVAGSSVKDASLKFLRIKSGTNSYRDQTCKAKNAICRWSTGASATPDPRPTAKKGGEVWGTNQYAGDVDQATDNSKFSTRIFAVRP